MRALVHLDFVNRRASSPLLGAVLLGLGVLAAAGTVMTCRATMQRRAGLELKLAALSSITHPSPEADARAARDAAASAKSEQDLATPWTHLLAELESASKDSAGQVSTS